MNKFLFEFLFLEGDYNETNRATIERIYDKELWA